jgi:hypothetical protein
VDGGTGEEVTGQCHFCPRGHLTEVSFCGFCGHYFCETCRDRWGKRAIGFFNELVGGKTEDCCGPV